MKYRLKKYLAIILLLVAIQTSSVPEAVARGAAFSFDSVWFDREGLRVVPEISTRWLTVVFEPRTNSTLNDFAATSDTTDSVIQRKAKAIIKSHDRLTEYLYDPNLAENACFFKMRPGLKLADIRHLINQLSQDRTVNYVHPTIVLNNKTFAFFNTFEMEWKTATPPAQRESLLSASHVAVEEHDKKDNRYAVDVTAIPFFRALNLLAEDIKVLRVTPSLVETKRALIEASLALYKSIINNLARSPRRLRQSLLDYAVAGLVDAKTKAQTGTKETESLFEEAKNLLQNARSLLETGELGTIKLRGYKLVKLFDAMDKKYTIANKEWFRGLIEATVKATVEAQKNG